MDGERGAATQRLRTMRRGSIARMGYKLLGYAVWQGGKWYLRRRFPHARRNAAIAGGVGVAVVGAAVAFAVTRRNRGD